MDTHRGRRGRPLRIVRPLCALTVRLRGGLTLRLWEAHDGRSRAYWCRRDGYVVRLVTPPLC